MTPPHLGELDLDGPGEGPDPSPRFRPLRYVPSKMGLALTCRFATADQPVGHATVLDIGISGVGLRLAGAARPAPGTVLRRLELVAGGHTVWTGEAMIQYATDGRVGARFLSGLFDPALLVSLAAEQSLDNRVGQLRQQTAELGADWRALVADLRLLLETVRDELRHVEARTRGVLSPPAEHKLLDRVFRSWSPAFYDLVRTLHQASGRLDRAAVVAARAYAATQLLPLVLPCPIHRRAYEKPRGFAGDHELLSLYFADTPRGDTLYGRLLHRVAQNYTLGGTLVARTEVLRSLVAAAAAAPGIGPVRILSLACGPAIELQRFVAGVARLERPLELILVDHDEQALETCHRELSRHLMGRRRGELPVRVTYLNRSIKQLLRPGDDDDAQGVRDQLRDLSLVYSAGLYDYLGDAAATALTRLCYRALRPGGRLYAGNLREAADTTWMMEFVLAWHLTYRSGDQLLALAEDLDPAPARASIVEDPTGHCLFLAVDR